MRSTTLYRASGLALLLGALLGIIGNVLSSALYPGNDPQQYLSPWWLIMTMATFIGQVLLLMGLPGIAARLAPKGGSQGFSGFVLAFLGGILLIGVSVVELLVFPSLAQAAPTLLSGNGPMVLLFFYFFILAGLLFGAGGLLLGIGVMRSGVLPHTAGLLALIGGALTIVAAPLSAVFGTAATAIAFAVFAVGLGWIGYALMSEPRMELTVLSR